MPLHRIALALSLILSAAAVVAAAATEPAPSGKGAEKAAAGGRTSIWTSRVRQRMVADAIKVAPPSLARIMRKHPDALLDGLARAAEFEGQPHHLQETDGPGTGAAGAMATVGGKAVDAVNRHRPMKDLVFYLGLTAHFASDLSDPVLTSPPGPGMPFAADYALYAQRNVDRFPVVFYGYPEIPATGPPPGIASLEPEGRVAAAQARQYYPHLLRAYSASGGSSASFDVRSIPFGVASLCYSRGVTSIARAWLHVWRAARGDLTDTPHLQRAAPKGEAAAREAAGRKKADSTTESPDVTQD
jgi:hypothetical protein